MNSLVFTQPSGSSTPLLREISTNITREATRASTLPEEEEEEEVEEEEDEVRATISRLCGQGERLYSHGQRIVFYEPLF